MLKRSKAELSNPLKVWPNVPRRCKLSRAGLVEVSGRNSCSESISRGLPTLLCGHWSVNVRGVMHRTIICAINIVVIVQVDRVI